MDEKTRRKLEMGRRALELCRAQPDSSPEYVAMVARLEMLLVRAEQLELLEQSQRSGSSGKVIPLKKLSKADPTDPAA